MSEEIKEEGNETSEEAFTEVCSQLKPTFSVDSDGTMKQVTFRLSDEIEEFKKRLPEVFKGFQAVFLPTERNYTHYIGTFRARKVEDVLDDGEELFKFCDQEILGKEIAEKAERLFFDKLNDFIANNDSYNKYFYEFIIELGRKDEDIKFDESEGKVIHRGAKDFYPPVSSEEINRRLKLSRDRYNEELAKAKAELVKVSDITKNLEEVCKTMEEELAKKEDPKLRKNLEKFRKNIKAIRTLNVLENVTVSLGKQFKNRNVSDEQKLRILGSQVNQLLSKDNKTQYDYEKLAKVLSKTVGAAKAIKFILKILAFTKMNGLTSYKIFSIKTLNDLLRLKFNSNTEEGKNFIEKVKNFLDKIGDK